jgi:DNA polymerase-3 subunit beta
MKFIIPKDALQKELAFVQSIVERKNMIPVLANVLIESVSDDTIRISGTGLDITLRVDAQVESMPTQGAICVQARKLFDIVRLLPNGPVTFTKEENEWVTVKCDKSTFRLPGIARETFPDLPSLQATPFSIGAGLLSTLIEKTIFAITTEEGRYTLSGAKFEVTKDSTKVITTDGHRLALIETKSGIRSATDEALDVLIPKKTLSELQKLATGFDGDVQLGVDENHVYFQIGTRALVSRLLSGQFPNYEMVLPKTNEYSATFATSDLTKALRRVALMADNRSYAVTLEINKEQTTITAQSPEEGEGLEVIASTLNGEDLRIGFNAQYVLDFLNVINSEQVLFTFKDGNCQTEFRPVTDETDLRFFTIIMPMRVD